ncbi:MAG: large-conductance mechanosensitive channel protein MscL [Clostridiales bacterium]|nr:large-conductance mechanosensitive channel protein MscL [Clostridiales bacterium]
MVKEFKEFISKGNVMDLAVGMIIGAAFTAIVNSVVNDLVMPLISIVVGKVNFSDLKWVIKAAEGEAEEVALCYGNFIQAVINFLVIALVIFLVVKGINSFRRKKEEEEEEKPAEEPKPSDELLMLTEIRDLLKKD